MDSTENHEYFERMLQSIKDPEIVKAITLAATADALDTMKEYSDSLSRDELNSQLKSGEFHRIVKERAMARFPAFLQGQLKEYGVI